MPRPEIFLGDLLMRADDLTGVRCAYDSALSIARAIRDRLGEANCFQRLGGSASAFPDIENQLGQQAAHGYLRIAFTG